MRCTKCSRRQTYNRTNIKQEPQKVSCSCIVMDQMPQVESSSSTVYHASSLNTQYDNTVCRRAKAVGGANHLTAQGLATAQRRRARLLTKAQERLQGAASVLFRRYRRPDGQEHFGHSNCLRQPKHLVDLEPDCGASRQTGYVCELTRTEVQRRTGAPSLNRHQNNTT